MAYEDFPHKLYAVIENSEFGETPDKRPNAYLSIEEALRYSTGPVEIAEYTINNSFTAKNVAVIQNDPSAPTEGAQKP